MFAQLEELVTSIEIKFSPSGRATATFKFNFQINLNFLSLSISVSTDNLFTTDYNRNTNYLPSGGTNTLHKQ